MNWFFLLVAAGALLTLLSCTVRLVARDGLGSGPVPRSHVEELGPWSAQELGR